MDGFVFLDAGGTQIKSAAYSPDGRPLCGIHSAPSRSLEDRDTILSNFLSVIDREKQVLLASGFTLGSVGFSFPGPFDYPAGICLIRGLHKYESIYGISLRQALPDFPGQHVIPPGTRFFFQHDMKSFALGEASRSLDPETGRILCLCIGTGAGSAFLENGRMLAKDPRVPDEGWIYPFPLRGAIVDDWISARGLERLAVDAGFPAGTTGKDLSRLAAGGDSTALAVWHEFGSLVAEALAPWVRSFRPQLLLFGGQISKAMDYFGAPVFAAFPGLKSASVLDTTESMFRGLYAAMTAND